LFADLLPGKTSFVGFVFASRPGAGFQQEGKGESEDWQFVSNVKSQAGSD